MLDASRAVYVFLMTSLRTLRSAYQALHKPDINEKLFHVKRKVKFISNLQLPEKSMYYIKITAQLGLRENIENFFMGNYELH